MAARTHGELLGNVRYALACRVIPNTNDRIAAQQLTFVFGITRQAKAYRTLLPCNKKRRADQQARRLRPTSALYVHS